MIACWRSSKKEIPYKPPTIQPKKLPKKQEVSAAFCDTFLEDFE